MRATVGGGADARARRSAVAAVIVAARGPDRSPSSGARVRAPAHASSSSISAEKSRNRPWPASALRTFLIATSGAGAPTRTSLRLPAPSWGAASASRSACWAATSSVPEKRTRYILVAFTGASIWTRHAPVKAAPSAVRIRVVLRVAAALRLVLAVVARRARRGGLCRAHAQLVAAVGADVRPRRGGAAGRDGIGHGLSPRDGGISAPALPARARGRA